MKRVAMATVTTLIKTGRHGAIVGKRRIGVSGCNQSTSAAAKASKAPGHYHNLVTRRHGHHVFPFRRRAHKNQTRHVPRRLLPIKKNTAPTATQHTTAMVTQM